MRKILDFLKRRWVISLLGFLALAVFIWFGGPLIAIAGYAPLVSALSRLVLILAILLLWVLNMLRKQLMARRADRQLIDGMAASEAAVGPGAEPETARSAEEVAALRERFDEAIEVLRKSGRKRGTRSLYELPWYIMIGPPGSGKTTALVNSGLEFPLADRFGKEALRGVGGTRNCDWWITNEAVLLDTAGRYVTQDSDAVVDSAAWENFLGLLKRYRRRRPINGALVAVSLPDLMIQSEEERSLHARAIKQRLQELPKHLGIRVPVYVLLTKGDLIAGFMEFFDDLGREERAQVWGMTFALDKGDVDVLGRFRPEFEALLDRLNDRSFWRLNQERDQQRRTLIYGFPQQMASLKETIDQFLYDIFRPSRFEEHPLLRGIYLTSGTQDGTPIDRLMGSIARSFGLDQQVLSAYGGHGRSYFITNLLKRVIFQERDLVGVNRRFEGQRAWLQRAAYAGAVLLTVLGALGWTTSFTANKAFVAEVGESVREYETLSEKPLPLDAEFAEVLPRLDALRRTTGLAEAHTDGVPVHMRLGLYQGHGLRDAARDAYVREMNAVFLPRIALRLEEQLQGGIDDPDFKYEALKVYLMLGNIDRLDPESVKLWMSLDWEQTYPAEPDKQGRLQAHLASLLEGGVQPVELDYGLITEVRASLRQVPLAELVYRRLKRQSVVNDTMSFRLSEAVGRPVEEVFVRASGAGLDEEIPGLFTYRGFYQLYQTKSRQVINQIREESWVLGSEQSELTQVELEQLDKNVLALYLEDYIQIWGALLRDLRIVPFRSIGHGSEVMGALSGPSSPMRKLLEAVARNTSLTRLPAGAEQLAEKAAERAAQRSFLARVLRSTAESTGGPPSELPGAPVDHHFERLNQVVLGHEGSTPPIEGIIDLLSQLYGHLNAISSGLGEGALSAAAGTSGRDILERLRIEAARQPEPVRTWLEQLAANSRSVTVGGARAQLNRTWTSIVLPVCDKALVNRYPLYKDAAQEITLKDFGRFFGVGGVMDDFFNNHLKPFVDTSTTPWRWRSAGGTPLGIPDAVLRQFQRAALIRETFFPDGGQRPTVRFTLKPVYLDDSVAKFLLDLEGQEFVYRHGPAVARDAQWPGREGPNQLRVVFEDLKGERHSITKEGPWAWFRLLDESKLESVSADRLIATFEVKGYMAKYEIRASSVVNPFLMEERERFRCPGSL
jgi:type VI secretion system protein ImpL